MPDALIVGQRRNELPGIEVVIDVVVDIVVVVIVGIGGPRHAEIVVVVMVVILMMVKVAVVVVMMLLLVVVKELRHGAKENFHLLRDRAAACVFEE